MNRREFVKTTVAAGLALAAGQLPAGVWAEAGPLAGLTIIDAHAHPDMDPVAWRDHSASYRYMKAVGMAAGSFAAIGDGAYSGLSRVYPGRSTRQIALAQLDNWRRSLIEPGLVTPVLKAGDLPPPGSERPGAILSVEGGDVFEGKTDRVDEFYRLGVRIITLVHYHNNEIGDIMYARPGTDSGSPRGGLSDAGRQIVERMQTLGMVVDVAHTDLRTLKGVCEVSAQPVIDSHTGPSYRSPTATRRRSWQEMELVAKTGGVVCIWPMAHQPDKTFADWAADIRAMKEHIGSEHIGLGTDGGGGLPAMVRGYRDVRDLGLLAEAMRQAGFSAEELAAFFGGNLVRVLQKCLG